MRESERERQRKSKKTNQYNNVHKTHSQWAHIVCVCAVAAR